MTISDAQPPPAANCGRRVASLPPTPVATAGMGVGFEKFVIGMVLKFVPRKRNARTATGVSEVTVSVPSKFSESSGTSEKSSLMNLDTCWRAPTVMVFAELVVPSPPRRSVMVTFVATLPGFTIATPMLRDRRGFAAAKNTVWVAMLPGRTPARVASAATADPKVSKTTSPPVAELDGEVCAKAAVDSRQRQRIVNND